jgi:hypothetical protein
MEAPRSPAVHPRLTHRAAWLEHEGELPLIAGTLIRLVVECLSVEYLSKDRAAKFFEPSNDAKLTGR